LRDVGGSIRRRADGLSSRFFSRDTREHAGQTRAALPEHAGRAVRAEISNGQDAQLQQFASETLPSVLHHLQAVQALLAELTGAAPQGLAMNSSLPGSERSGQTR